MNEKEQIVKEDCCPLCGTLAADFKYINVALMQTFGLLECTGCGVVFCPTYIRSKKTNRTEPNRIIIPEIVPA